MDCIYWSIFSSLNWNRKKVLSMISIIDYGLGNVDAFLTVYKRLGYEACRVKSKDDLNYASKIILPGQ